MAYARDRSTSSLHWLVRHSAAIFGVWVCLLVCSAGACTGRRGWLSPLPGTAFRRWVLWVPPVSPPALDRSAFVVRLVSRIAQWEEIEKLPFSIALSAFGTLELAQVLVPFLTRQVLSLTRVKGNRSDLALNCFYVLSLLYLRKLVACLAMYSARRGVVVMPILSSGARCVRLDDARSPLSPGLCLVSTSDVALLCRIFDVVLGLVSGARVPSPCLLYTSPSPRDPE